jgi:hypothetical protein
MEGWPEVHLAEASKDHLPDGRVLTRSHDLFGCFDVLACGKPANVFKPDQQTWALQVTTPKNRAARRKKIEGRPWPTTWRVSVLVVKDGALHIEDFCGGTSWTKSQAYPVVEADVRSWHAAWKAGHKQKKPRSKWLKDATAEAQRRTQ